MRSKMRRRRRAGKTLNLFLTALLRSLTRLHLLLPSTHEPLLSYPRDVDFQIRLLGALDYLSLRNLADIDDLRLLNALLLLKPLLKQV
jgi:hypothetical protein